MDDADEWWINWGRFCDAATARILIDFSQAAFLSVTSSVETITMRVWKRISGHSASRMTYCHDVNFSLFGCDQCFLA
jgi:hypothetical protein